MKKVLIVFTVLFIGLLSLKTNAQVIRNNKGGVNLFQNKTLTDSTTFKNEVQIKLDGKTSYKDYKLISVNNDTTLVDTTLTLAKDFKFNYLRKDNFELLPFHNQGQTFNKLAYNFENKSILPVIGFNAKQFNYYKVEDVFYYDVPTPTSEFMYRTGLEQGQVLDAFLTMNTSRQFNFSLAYKGLRSLGKYRNSLSSHGNFRSTFNYHSKNKSYLLRGHFASYDLLNNENGGLTPQSIAYFENENPNYKDRGRLEVNFTDANNLLEGKRYFLEQTVTLYSKKNIMVEQNNKISADLKKRNALLKKIEGFKRDTISIGKTKMKDSVTVAKAIFKIDSLSLEVSKIKADSSQLKKITKKDLISLQLGNSLTYETAHYRYNQSKENSIFGSAYNTVIKDHTSFQKMNNEIFVQFKAPYLGSLKTKIEHFNYNYHYNSVLILNEETIAEKLKGEAFTVGADWKTNFGKFYLNSSANSIVFGDITGHSLKASIGFKKDSIYKFEGFAELTSKSPDFSTLLYQSTYKNFNWQHSFKNEQIKNIGLEINFEKWGSIEASYNLVDNLTYFNSSSKPEQASETLNYTKIKAHNSITFRKFTLDNTVMYQRVLTGESFFRVPEIVTRNTLYFSSYVFKGKPMYLQTGVTLKYFTAFKANAYNPLISEFVLQDDMEIGNYPLLDFFVNAQIRRTRLYFKIENISAAYTGRNYYVAPNYPYRDLTVRFGLVWNFFI